MGMQVCALCATGEDSYHKILQYEPTIAILAVNTPKMNAIKVMERLSSTEICTNIIVMTEYRGSALYRRAKALGAKGYLLKTFPFNEFEKCIDLVSKGENYFSEMIDNNLENHDLVTEYERLNKLTVTELKILEMIAYRKSTKEIASEIYIADKTVENHRRNIAQKLNLLPNQNSLMVWALEHKVMLGEW